MLANIKSLWNGSNAIFFCIMEFYLVDCTVNFAPKIGVARNKMENFACDEIGKMCMSELVFSASFHLALL